MLTHLFVNQGVVGTLVIILGLRATMTFTSFGCKMTCEDPATGKFSWKIDKHFSWVADKECPKAGPEQFGTNTVFWAIGAILVYLSSAGVGSKYGCKFVLAVTNFFSKSIGIEYKMHGETLVSR